MQHPCETDDVATLGHVLDQMAGFGDGEIELSFNDSLERVEVRGGLDQNHLERARIEPALLLSDDEGQVVGVEETIRGRAMSSLSRQGGQ